MRKARNRALAVWTRAVPEERIEDASEVNDDAVEMDVSGSESRQSCLIGVATKNLQICDHRSQDKNADTAVSRVMNDPVPTDDALLLVSQYDDLMEFLT